MRKPTSTAARKNIAEYVEEAVKTSPNLQLLRSLKKKAIKGCKQDADKDRSKAMTEYLESLDVQPTETQIKFLSEISK